MRLKSLELHGYKSFASRTGFVFDGGITAIVGPNGSGKSNVADAIRWVLGEQSYRSLRGKRTEDMIFSGSSQRARMGMALASLTLDNADGWLPIDFVEVTVARRAYRSGENEYLVNGSRVRLRDVSELLARSGLARRTYTVVGQGLVDAVLSLRPEDRRELFEEAAGISLYQSKRVEALARLEETRANLLRINDIVNEIAPRLRRLEREAERAERHALLTRQLEGLLRIWYGYRWRQEQRTLHRTRDAVARREEALARRREALDDLDRQETALRARQSQLREQLSGWHRESGELHRQMEVVQRELAVKQERARLLARQGDELEAELADLETQAQAAAERIAAAEEDVAVAQAALAEKETLVQAAQVELDAHEARRAELSRSLADAQARAFDLAAQARDRQNRLAQLGERRAALGEERATHQAAIAAQEVRAGELAAQVRAVDAELARLRAQAEALAAEQSELEAAQVAAQARQADLRAWLAEAQRQAERLQTRYDLLSRLRAEGEGLHAGVRAVLQAASSKQQAATSTHHAPRTTLSGIIGTVAQLLHVPEQYEVAVEVALGGHLQDVVVERWPDAEAAIAFLREGQRGRATFLPLDTVRPVPRLDLPDDAGVVGLAADLIEAEVRLAPVVEMLLGRTVVARDLKAGRRVFDRLRGGFQIVTLDGEVLRSSGSVTGGEGQGQAHGEVLAREREWRGLPGQLAAARARAGEVEASLAEAQAAEAEVRQRLAALGSRQRDTADALAVSQAQRREREGEAERVAQQIAWRQGLIAQLAGEADKLDAAESAGRAELERLVAGQGAAERQVEALQADLAELRGDALYLRLSEARTAAAVARGAWEHRQAALGSLEDRQRQLRRQVEAKQARIAELAAERAGLAEQMERQASREAVIQGWLTSLGQKIEPAEAEVAQLEAQREELDREETTLRTRLRQAESGHSQAVLAYSRQEDRLERLRRQIMDDFGLVEMEPTEGLAEQPPLPLGDLVSALPLVEVLPEGLEDEIHQIKAQIRRMGAVNPDAPDEYGEVLDRYTFLTTQAADLEEAASSLREVIAELDEVMRREFHATFEAVAARFELKFTQLFGGGTARLVLTDPDDVSQTGVDIVARPPGKRQQTLALLSGGERSLTAVALIFSILEVSPPPFCILDEVDAMLDEANVRRFRAALEELAEKTQFIIITHNRGTIQAADTIYGVSMGDDSVSQVVSLRLEGDRIAAPDGTTVDVAKAG
jgi:chromosome segregation protein